MGLKARLTAIPLLISMAIGFTPAIASAASPSSVTIKAVAPLLNPTDTSTDFELTCHEDVDNMSIVDSDTLEKVPRYTTGVFCRAGTSYVLEAGATVDQNEGHRNFRLALLSESGAFLAWASNEVRVDWDPIVVTPSYLRTGIDRVEIRLDINHRLETYNHDVIIYRQIGDEEPIVMAWCSVGRGNCFTTQTHRELADESIKHFYRINMPTGRGEPVPIARYMPPVFVKQESQAGTNDDMPQSQACAGDPINTFTMVYFDCFHDLSMVARGPQLAMSRHYSTALIDRDVGMGPGWSHPWSWESESTDSHAKITDHRGNITEFNRSTDGSWSGPEFVRQKLTGDATTGLKLYREKSMQTLTFALDGKLTSICDNNDECLTMTYGGGNLVRVDGQPGQHLSLAWNGSELASVSDHTGRVAEYTYTGGLLMTSEAPESHRWDYTYDAAGRITSKTDSRGGRTVNEYDSTGQIDRQVESDGRATQYYNDLREPVEGMALTMVDSDEGWQRHLYENGVLISEEDSNLGTTNLGYDPVTLDLVHHQVDKDITSTRWDSGNPVQVTYPDGSKVSRTWTEDGQVSSSTDQLGHVTAYEYDDRGNLSSLTDVDVNGDPRSTTWAYGDSSNPGDATSTTDGLGQMAPRTYDPRGSLIASTDRTSRTTTYEHDALGKPLTVITPDGGVTTTEYSSSNSPTATTDPTGRTKTFTYNDAGDPTLITAPDGSTTEYAWRPDGTPSLITTDGTSKTFTYDKLGRKITEADKAGNLTRFTYAYGRDLPERITSPDGERAEYDYDRNGLVLSKNTPEWGGERFTRDWAGRVTHYNHFSSAAGTKYFEFEYDASGKTISMEGDHGSVEYTHAADGSLLEADWDNDAHDVGYGYDKLGRQTSVIYPGGDTINREFDAEGRMLTLTDWADREHGFKYDQDGELSKHQLPGNAVATDRSHDAAGRLTGLETKIVTTGTGLADFDYSYGAGGQVEAINTTGAASWNTPDQVLGYDTNQRIASDERGAYGWNDSNDLTAIPGDGGREFGDIGQLMSFTVDGASTAFEYDRNGSRSSKQAVAGSTEYTYSGTLQMTEHTAGGVSTSYTYNPDGLRHTKESGGNTERFAWDTTTGHGMLLADGANQYVYGPTGHLIQQTAKATDDAAYPIANVTGSIQAWADSAGAVLGQAAYDTYGAKTDATGFTSPFGYAGEYLDDESGLIYLRARYYDPEVAQFTTVDPKHAITGDRYGYAAGDPTLITDPGGECPVCLGAALGGAMSAATYIIEHGYTDNFSLQELGVSAGVGIAAGAAGAGLGAVVGRFTLGVTGKIGAEAGVGAVVGVGEGFTASALSGTGPDAAGVIESAAFGALGGALPGLVGKYGAGPSQSMNDVTASIIQFHPESVSAALKRC